MMHVDFGAVPSAGLAFDAETRREAWQISISQAADTLALEALEARLYRRLDMLRTKERGSDIEREALTLCGERRAELIAGPQAPPSAPGGVPASQDGPGQTATAKKEQHQW